MTVFRVSNLSISFQGRSILRNIDAVLTQGSRVGIVGRNGCGKTTFLKAIVSSFNARTNALGGPLGGPSGDALGDAVGDGLGAFAEGLLMRKHLSGESHGDQDFQADEGSIDWVEGVRIGYVPQVFPYPLSLTAANVIGFDKVRFLGQCGIGKDLRDKPVGDLSGGEKTRLCIACALSWEPNLLIMDEPTNHLDIAGIEWLEKFLLGFHGSLLCVSHDRFFMNKVCAEIWEIRDGMLHCYPGSYTKYLEQRRVEEARAVKEREKWTTSVRNLEMEVRERSQWYQKAHKDAGNNDFRRRKAKKHAKQFKAKETALRRLIDQEPEKPEITKWITADIAHRGYRTKIFVKAEGLTFAYHTEVEPGSVVSDCLKNTSSNENGTGGTKIATSRGKGHLLENLMFLLQPGQKVGLIGPNGCGKTTLLRLIAGELTPYSGQLWVNPNIKVGYMKQMLESFDLEKSATEQVVACTGLSKGEARNLLGKVGISNETQVQAMAAMSQGEKARVALACLTFGYLDLILLDEPTNHLDSIARDAVESALSSFSGGILVATHDRYLIDRVCNTVWRLEQGTLTEYRGNYTAYKQFLDDRETNAEEKDLSAHKFALKARLAYIASRIAVSRDENERRDLDRQYRDVLEALNLLER